MKVAAIASIVFSLVAGVAMAQQNTFGPAKVTEPWEAFTFTESVVGSTIPVDITLLETVDGLFTPIGMRKPAGPGPFPVVLMFSGNGGSGVQSVRFNVNGQAGYTMNKFLEAGYAVGWLNYRAEAWFAYTKAEPLKVSKHEWNQITNRPVMEYNDLMTIVEYVKRLPYIDPKRVGVIGNSHGGGMILRASAEGMDVAAAIIHEPDASEFLQLDPKIFDVEEAPLHTMDKVIPHVDKKLAMERIKRIKVPHLAFFNRDHDHMQGLFELAYTWVKEGGHPDTEHFSFEHDVHGYLLRVKKDDKGVYQPDAVQLKAIPAAIDFFNRSMKASN
jgi:dienelactone hydrolase